MDYKAKLDRVFSKYIRLRDSDLNGNVKCYCCGKILPATQAHNMHFIPRQHMSLRYDIVNCHAGCVRCNHYMNGNIEEYALHLQRDYGEDVIKSLVAKKHRPRKISQFEYIELIKYYQNEIKRIQADRSNAR